MDHNLFINPLITSVFYRGHNQCQTASPSLCSLNLCNRMALTFTANAQKALISPYAAPFFTQITLMPLAAILHSSVDEPLQGK